MSANEALLLVGHGSARYADAADGLGRHAAVLRSDPWVGQIEIGLLNGTPTIETALQRVEAPSLRIVPFFMEDGYFSRVAIPRAVAAALLGRELRTRQCPPIGLHSALPAIIERQAMAGCAWLAVPPSQAAVVVVGHGSATAPGRSLALHAHTAAVKDSFARVEAACLEEAPFLADVLLRLRRFPVLVIGFFANRGGHVRDDVPTLIAAERAARGSDGPEVHFQASVTDDAEIPRIILDQAALGLARQ